MDAFAKKLLTSLVAIAVIASLFTGFLLTPERAEATDGTLLWEDFEGSFPPPGWTIVQYSGSGTWQREAYGVEYYQPPGTGSYYAEADSDEHMYDIFDTGLFTPSIDCSWCSNVRLTFARNFQEYMGLGYAEVNTYSGGTGPGNLEENLWNQTFDDPWDGVHTTLFFDPSGYTDPSHVYIEFYYTTEGGTYAWKLAIDDVVVECESSIPRPTNVKYLHAEGGWMNITDPVGTQWHELYPIFCRNYHLSSWEDNGDGVLSPCDQIDMYEKPDGEVRWYHVENVTITLLVTPAENPMVDGNDLHSPQPPLQGARQPMYIEFKGGYNASVLMNPVCSQWHEIYPKFCTEYQINDWIDGGNPTGELGFCDYIALGPRGACIPAAMCSLDEDFSGDWPPSGWATDDWDQSYTSYAGGTSPEAFLAYYNITGDYSYLDSKPVDTSGMSSLTLEFKSFIDDWIGGYNCTVYTRAHGGDGWTDVTPSLWMNPIYGDVPANTYSVDISSDIGSATQVRFEFNGPNYIDFWYVDDVKICGVPEWWHVEEVAVDIVVAIEPPPVGGEAYPVNKASLLAPWIAMGVVLAGGTSWYVLRRRRAGS